jgi:ribonuclease R
VHEGPAPEKLENLREFLKGFGLGLAGGEKPKAKDFAKLLDSVRPRPDAKLLQTVMLRSLKQAVYTPENKGFSPFCGRRFFAIIQFDRI